MKAIIIIAIFLLATACNDRPANSSYHNSSNEVRQNDKNTNTNVNTNVNANLKR